MDRLNTFIDRSAPVLLGRLKRLVGFQTINPPGQDYEAVTGYLTRELEKIGLSAKRLQIPDKLLRKCLPEAQYAYPRYNVIGKLKAPGAKKTIHFNAHYDVVPVSGTWRHGSPFSGAVEKGLIYGRGTADMKGSIASLITALDALRQTRTKPLMNVEVSFTADEETDSFLGSRWVVDEAPISPDYAIVMEGAEGEQVCCGHNGTLWLEVTVHGRAAHGSTPQDGVNALEKMAALVLELEAYKRKIGRRTFVTPEGTTMRPTINVGGVFSCGEGAKINTVPATASFSIDRRVLPSRTTLPRSATCGHSSPPPQNESRAARSRLPRSRRTTPASRNQAIRSSRPWPRASGEFGESQPSSMSRRASTISIISRRT